MDIHRCRFVPYPPHAINALAVSPPASTNAQRQDPSSLRLAVGRANGDIEIWNPAKGAWLQETILRGGKDRSIEGLAWTQDPDEEDADGHTVPGKLRLFSIGYSTTVTEWDLDQGRPARHSGGNYGEIWCLAAQPRWEAQKSQKTKDGKSIAATQGANKGQHLAAGCADGSIVVLSTEDGELRYLRTMTRPSAKRARVLSITFKDRNMIVAGYADSTIRIFDIRNGRLLRNMSLGKGPAGDRTEILVWTVKCLPDGTIVSGDSTGEVRFWDAKNYSLFQRIHSHRADVLAIAISADGETIISGGADRRSTLYRLKGVGKGERQGRWVELMHRRFHEHDVKAIAALETDDVSVAVSGGLDTTPVIVPLRKFGKENHRTLSSLPQAPQLASSPSSRLLMSWWDREINIWRVVGYQRQNQLFDRSHDSRRFTLVAKVLLKGEENITSASLSHDGNLLALSTISEVKVFSLTERAGKPALKLRVQKIEVSSELSKSGARLVAISPDSRWICVVRPNSEIFVAKIVIGMPREKPGILSKVVKLGRPLRSTTKRGLCHRSLGPYDRTVRCIAFSSDSRIIATGDVSGYIDTWILEGYEDLTQEDGVPRMNGKASSSTSTDEGDSSDEDNATIIQGQHWLRNPLASHLPKMGSAITCLSFRPRKASTALPHINGNIAIHPTRHNPHPHSHDVPVSEDRLLALTIEHELCEFEVLQGRLSDWSRRNPSSYLPKEFRNVIGRTMGCLWDVCGAKERLWFYGPSWLSMLDLSKDLPDPRNMMGQYEVLKPGEKPENISLKRKRDDDTKNEGMGRDGGAGRPTPVSESYVGLGRKMRKMTGVDNASFQLVSMEVRKRSGNEDDDDFAPGTSLLAKTRRDASEGEIDKGHADTSINDQKKSAPNGTLAAVKRIQDDRPAWWNTYKYREILGIVQIGEANSEELNEEDDTDGFDLEVALIERPMWAVDLPPRFDGDQEWDT